MAWLLVGEAWRSRAFIYQFVLGTGQTWKSQTVLWRNGPLATSLMTLSLFAKLGGKSAV